jgi:uncharacterized protein YecT (DUF1311 family)
MALFLSPALSLLLAAAPTETGAEDGYRRCLESTQTNPEWQDCGETYLERLDEELNAAWQTTFSSLDEPSRKQLLAEQRSWLKFRDTSCLYWNEGHGREGQVLQFYACRGSIILARIADLHSIYVAMNQDEQ